MVSGIQNLHSHAPEAQNVWLFLGLFSRLLWATKSFKFRSFYSIIFCVWVVWIFNELDWSCLGFISSSYSCAQERKICPFCLGYVCRVLWANTMKFVRVVFFFWFLVVGFNLLLVSESCISVVIFRIYQMHFLMVPNTAAVLVGYGLRSKTIARILWKGRFILFFCWVLFGFVGFSSALALASEQSGTLVTDSQKTLSVRRPDWNLFWDAWPQ